MNIRVIAVILTILFSHAVMAHSFSDSFLVIDKLDSQLQSQWSVSLQDLDVALDLDLDRNGGVSWGELKHSKTLIDAYAAENIIYLVDDARCTHSPGVLLADRRNDIPYAVLRFNSDCPAPATSGALTVHYDALFNQDPQHRGFINLIDDDAPAAIARLEHRIVQLGGRHSFSAVGLTYGKEGIWHIWTGIDHLAFLLTLLLGVWGTSHATQASATRRGDMLKIITAFTVSHSITLVLGSLGLISLPSMLVEFVIAASIAIAAVVNLLPGARALHVPLAFVFGLIHGLGFAEVLASLETTGSSFIMALVSFNVGVEIGQLAVVAIVFGLAALTKRIVHLPVRIPAARTGSAIMVIVGLAWTFSRAAA